MSRLIRLVPFAGLLIVLYWYLQGVLRLFAQVTDALNAL